MQTALPIIWTQIIVSIFYDKNRYATNVSLFFIAYHLFYPESYYMVKYCDYNKNEDKDISDLRSDHQSGDESF